MVTSKFSVVIEKNSGGYFAFCPELQGCYTQDDIYEEVLENIKDAIRLHIEYRIESLVVFRDKISTVTLIGESYFSASPDSFNMSGNAFSINSAGLTILRLFVLVPFNLSKSFLSPVIR